MKEANFNEVIEYVRTTFKDVKGTDKTDQRIFDALEFTRFELWMLTKDHVSNKSILGERLDRVNSYLPFNRHYGLETVGDNEDRFTIKGFREGKSIEVWNGSFTDVMTFVDGILIQLGNEG